MPQTNGDNKAMEAAENPSESFRELPVHNGSFDPAPAPPLAIETRGLRKVYGDKAAVNGLDLRVPAGCFYGFLGPNGAGKTTTIKMLMGVSQPSAGEMFLLGQAIDSGQAGSNLDARRRVGLVPDETLLFDHLSGAEYIEFVGRMYGLPRVQAAERAGELMDFFELSTAGNKLIAEYSKGMRKRVAMAAALIHRPQLFLMDEPFEGVDAVGARLMKDLLLDLVRNGATIFLTSHVLEVVERLCDRIAIIHEGSLVAEGTLEELRNGAETLEDLFVRTVGDHHARSGDLSWL